MVCNNNVMKSIEGMGYIWGMEYLPNIKLGQIKDFNDLICNWKFKEYEESRLYFKITPDNGGFMFHSVKYLYHEKWEDKWSSETMVEDLIYGWACFDGVRDIHFGHEATDDFGSIHYPNLDDLIQILKHIKDIQDNFCTDFTGCPAPSPTAP